MDPTLNDELIIEERLNKLETLVDELIEENKLIHPDKMVNIVENILNRLNNIEVVLRLEKN